jgi:flagellar basal-body rod modification protein FlgD
MPEAVSSTEGGSIHYVRKSTEQSGIKVDTELFLKLLISQIKYQDPLEPQSNTELVAELAQMSEMEQLQQMNSSLIGSQSYALIGKYAYAEVLDDETGVTNSYFGKVTSVMLKSGESYAVMGDRAVSISDISQVFDSSFVEQGAEAGEDEE